MGESFGKLKYLQIHPSVEIQSSSMVILSKRMITSKILIHIISPESWTLLSILSDTHWLSSSLHIKHTAFRRDPLSFSELLKTEDALPSVGPGYKLTWDYVEY